MRTTLIITTYNRPRVLSLILDSVLTQTVLPDEVIIADDGSGKETAEEIAKRNLNYPVPLVHARQEDLGFRVARVRNLGAHRATGDYLIFIDGDMILHNKFVESHLMFARKGVFLHGPRVLITQKLTKKIISTGEIPRINPLQVPMSHRFNSIHSEFLAKRFSKETDKVRSRACNLSLFKKDLIAVNGFNEDFKGWGEEDSEFAWRLLRRGLKKVQLRFSAVGYHLDHGNHNELAHKGAYERNVILFEKVRKRGASKCRNGYKNHVKAPVYELDRVSAS